MDRVYDFIFGVQYYRAPTPSRDNWESDIRKVRENGFNSIKFWVQWGWTHRDEEVFYFDDIDTLMDLAYQNGLKVTLNVIFDVAPVWVYDKYPESKMVLASGKVVEPRVVGHRQIGGFPGTCYNHKAAFHARMLFLEKTVERYKDHPAMDMWDIWNEPEQCGPYRFPKTEELACFCPSCKAKFKDYLKRKYQDDIEKLNDVWGRCYRSFDDLQLPGESCTFSDFMDFREFHLDTMTAEANSRIRLVKKLDQSHPVYLHVVPNTSSIFNAMTGVDDFAMAKECDLFASTNFASPIWSILTTSAGRGKVCYNVECHIGNGSTAMHQKQITLKDMVRDLVPQIGMGIRGFMFWQYRPEVLGLESPAWGVTKPDGSIGSVGLAAKEFIGRLGPYTHEIMGAKAPEAEIAIWKGRKNEILSFAIHNDLTGFAKSIEAYVNGAYYNNYNCRIVDDETIAQGLPGVKLLILPYCYGADRKLMDGVDDFVRKGGTLLCEAHLGAYNGDSGRHSYRMPGLGADELWGIREEYTTSAYHLESMVEQGKPDTSAMADDVKKAIAAYGLNGGKNFRIHTDLGFDLMGAERFACVSGSGAEVIGTFNGVACIIRQKCGKGTIFYCGTNLGEGAEADGRAFGSFLDYLAGCAGVEKNPFSQGYGLHVDRVSENIIAVNNQRAEPVELKLDGSYRGLYAGGTAGADTYVIRPGSADLLVRED